MNEEDKMLCAWLKKRGFNIHEWGGELSMTRMTNGPGVTTEVSAEHLHMWVTADDRFGSNVWSKQLYKEQRGKRRPLRSLVRRWVIGL